MAGGLSTMNFMDGVVKGYGFAENVSNNRKRIGLAEAASNRAERQIGLAEAAGMRQQEEHDFNMDNKKQDRLMNDLKMDLRRYGESGQLPDVKKYESLGLGRLLSPDLREKDMQVGALMHRSVVDGKWDNHSLDGINLMLEDDLGVRTERDGLKRLVIDAKEVPTGRNADGDGVEDVRLVPILGVTKPDGSSYAAPLTKQGTSSDDDDIYTVNDAKLNEWYNVSINRANMAYQMQKAGDHKAQANVLSRIFFGSDLYPSAKGDFTLKQAWDETGAKRVAAVDNKTGRFSHWIGGASLADAARGGRGGGNAKDQDKLLWEQVADYQAAMQKAVDSGDPGAVQQIDDNFRKTTGFDFNQIESVQSALLNSGQNRRVSMEDLLIWKQEQQIADQSLAVNNAIAENPAIFSRDGQQTPAGSLQQFSKAPPRLNDASPRVISQEVAQQVIELEQKAADPNYPDNARADFQAKADLLRAENTPPQAAPPKPMTRSEKLQREIDYLRKQIAAGPGSLKAQGLAIKLADLLAQQNAPKGGSDQHLAGF